MSDDEHFHLSLLNLPIEELPFSERFKLRSKLMGFFTLHNILDTDQKELHLHEDYSENWYFEFLEFLERNQLIYILDH